MRIVDAHWFADVNHLTIECGCGNEFAVRADRWNVKCPQCRGEENLHSIRERYVMENHPTNVNFRLPRVTVTASFAVSKEERYDSSDGNPTIPRRYMDEIQKLIGDGKARVSVTADFGIKDFGTGVSASCTVSLTCNQDAQTIEQAASIAGDLARDLAQEQRQRAEQDLQNAITSRGPQGGRPPYAG